MKRPAKSQPVADVSLFYVGQRVKVTGPSEYSGLYGVVHTASRAYCAVTLHPSGDTRTFETWELAPVTST